MVELVELVKASSGCGKWNGEVGVVGPVGLLGVELEEKLTLLGLLGIPSGLADPEEPDLIGLEKPNSELYPGLWASCCVIRGRGVGKRWLGLSITILERSPRLAPRILRRRRAERMECMTRCMLGSRRESMSKH